MVDIIETVLAVKNNEVCDFQSRTIQVDSWDEYCEEFKNYDRHVDDSGKCVTDMHGKIIHAGQEIQNLMYNNYQLQCDVIWQLGKNEIVQKHLAYLCDESLMK